VVSGFLITGLLWRELQERGTISFTSFYARRARRLLPAAVLVLVVTTVASALVLSPLRARAVVADARAAALYVANLRFAAQRADYLAAAAPPSPLQHYWSLAVEEQFYLAWPLLMLVCSLAWRRSRAVSPRAVTVVLGAVGLTSLALCIRLTDVSQPTAFFMLPTRAWELAAGGLIAIAGVHVARLPRLPAAVAGWTGMAAIVWSVTRLTSSTPFPGIAALAPVAGTAALLVAGCAAPRRGVSLLLGKGALRAVGRISYSWYLWHWPALVLAPEVVGHPLGRVASFALTAATGLLAFATVAIVENPPRYSVRLAARPRWSLAGGLALSGMAFLVAAVVGVGLPSLVGRGGPAVAAVAAAPRSATGPRTSAATRSAGRSTTRVSGESSVVATTYAS
jgi:peptidoglycan/LPS O-acetylase OafA/YrhL